MWYNFHKIYIVIRVNICHRVLYHLAVGFGSGGFSLSSFSDYKAGCFLCYLGFIRRRFLTFIKPLPGDEKKLKQQKEQLTDIANAVLLGRRERTLALVKEGFDAGIEPLALISSGLTVGMDMVGQKFEEGEYYLPDMMLAAEAMNQAIDYLEPHLARERKDNAERSACVVIGTVKGDLHSIGKDIVIMMLKAAGMVIHDLGVDVEAAAFVRAAEENKADILGISALMTTTIQEQKKIIDLLGEKGLRDRTKVIVGGAPISEAWAAKIGADAYATDAVAGVKKSEPCWRKADVRHHSSHDHGAITVSIIIL